jgi:hypothetical protein
MVGHWKFDEASGVSAADSSSSGTTGTLLNGATWTPGRFGNAVRFDGVDDYVNLGNPAALNLGTGSFSYSLWVQVSQSAGAYDMPIWKGGSSQSAPGFDMELGTGGWTANLADGVNSLSVTFGNETLNEWVLLTAVVDRSAKQFLAYKNGALVATSALGSLGSVSSSEPARIGASTQGFSFKGIIDDVRVYNRVLSLNEVLSLYNTPTSAPPANPPVSDLVGNWKFDEVSGLSASDASPSGITGSLVNGPIWTPGKSGGALRFDGVDDHVNLGNPAALNFGTGSFSYSLWVQVSQSAGAYDMPWFNGGASASSPGFDMELGTGAWTATLADGVNVVGVNFGNEALNQWVLLTVFVYGST